MAQKNEIKRSEKLSYQQSFFLSTYTCSIFEDVCRRLYLKEITKLQAYCFIDIYKEFILDLRKHPESRWQVFSEYNVGIIEIFGKNSKYMFEIDEEVNNLGLGHGMIFFLAEIIINEKQNIGDISATDYQYYVSAREVFLSDLSEENGERFLKDLRKIMA